MTNKPEEGPHVPDTVALLEAQAKWIAELEEIFKDAIEEVTYWPTEAGKRDARIAELKAAIDEILNYSGGANNALEDEYVMERVRAALGEKE